MGHACSVWYQYLTTPMFEGEPLECILTRHVLVFLLCVLVNAAVKVCAWIVRRTLTGLHTWFCMHQVHKLPLWLVLYLYNGGYPHVPKTLLVVSSSIKDVEFAIAYYKLCTTCSFHELSNRNLDLQARLKHIDRYWHFMSILTRLTEVKKVKWAPIRARASEKLHMNQLFPDITERIMDMASNEPRNFWELNDERQRQQRQSGGSPDPAWAF